jgi:hypothetical protein
LLLQLSAREKLEFSVKHNLCRRCLKSPSSHSDESCLAEVCAACTDGNNVEHHSLLHGHDDSHGDEISINRLLKLQVGAT